MRPMALTFAVLCTLASSLGGPAPSWGPAPYGAWGGAAAPANIVLSADGKNVLDTPEVAHAKAAHLAALAQAQARSGPDHGQDDGSYDSRWENEGAWGNGAPAQQWGPSQGRAWAPAPAQQWGPSPAWNGAPGPVHDTPEVSQAKAAHFAALANARGGPAPGAWGPAPISLSHDGQYIQDTPEVAQAKAEHLAAHAKAGAHSSPAPVWNGAPSWQSAPARWNASPAWNQHAAAPVSLSHDGQYVQDTPEVAQAKAAHLAAHAQARGHGGPAW